MENKANTGIARPRILVVHESRIMRASITRHIKHHYDCLEATDLEAGWKMLQDDPGIEVVLVDLALPREDGVQFVVRVSSSEIERVAATPVIVIASEDGHTGNSVEEARQRALKAGAIDFIGKSTTAAETVARIGAAQRIGALRLALNAQKVATSGGLPIDPTTGLMTAEYLEVAGQQLFAYALHHQSELAALAIAIDDLAAIDARLGVALSPVVSRELSVVMARCLRREDTIVVTDTGRFIAVLPGIAIDELAELVGRMQAKLAATVMRYAGEIVQVTVSVGAASLLSDASRDVKQLIEVAQRRLMDASARSAGQFEGATPLPPAEAPIAAQAAPDDNSIDAVLIQLKDKQADQVKPDLYRLTVKLMPLLRLIEREFQMNFKLSRLKERASSARGGAVVEN